MAWSASQNRKSSPHSLKFPLYTMNENAQFDDVKLTQVFTWCS